MSKCVWVRGLNKGFWENLFDEMRLCCRDLRKKRYIAHPFFDGVTNVPLQSPHQDVARLPQLSGYRFLQRFVLLPLASPVLRLTTIYLIRINFGAD